MAKDKVGETIKTYEKTAEWYAEKHSDDTYLIKQQIDFFIENIKGKRILDVGCGPGRDVKYFSERGFEVVGIDLSENFIRIASEKVPEARFALMDMRKMEFPGKQFDGIWACGSFQHLPKKDARKALLEFRRVLKRGGLVYVSVKEGTGEKEIRKEHYRGGSKLFSFYRRDEIEELFKSCGFGVIKVMIKRNKDVWINLFAINP